MAGFDVPRRTAARGGVRGRRVVLHELGRQLVPSPFLASAILGDRGAGAAGNAAAARHGCCGCAAASDRERWPRPTRRFARPARSTSAGVPTGGVRLDGVARFVPDAHVADVSSSARRTRPADRLAVVDAARRASGSRRADGRPTRRLAGSSSTTSRSARPAPRRPRRPVPLSTGLALARRDRRHRRRARRRRAHARHDRRATPRQRQQFGRPIGSFQAVKHHCADMLIAVEASRAALCRGARTADDRLERRASPRRVRGRGVREAACAPGRGASGPRRHRLHLGARRPPVPQAHHLDEALYGTAAWHRRRLGRASPAR